MKSTTAIINYDISELEKNTAEWLRLSGSDFKLPARSDEMEAVELIEYMLLTDDHFSNIVADFLAPWLQETGELTFREFNQKRRRLKYLEEADRNSHTCDAVYLDALDETEIDCEECALDEELNELENEMKEPVIIKMTEKQFVWAEEKGFDIQRIWFI